MASENDSNDKEKQPAKPGALKRFFNRLVGKEPPPIHKIRQMGTKKLPIPDFGGEDYYVRFVAKRDKRGQWEISSETNCTMSVAGMEKCREALAKLKKDVKGETGGTHWLNLDETFLVLSGIEKSLLDYDKRCPGKSADPETPKDHFGKVLERMPETMQMTLMARAAEIEGTDKKLLEPKRIDGNVSLPTRKPGPTN